MCIRDSLLFIIISVMNDSFLEFSNLRNLLRQVSINAIIAFGMTFVILTGGIDLSVGSDVYKRQELLIDQFKTPAVTLGTAQEHPWLPKMYESFGFKAVSYTHLYRS